MGALVLFLNVIETHADFNDSTRSRRWYVPQYIPMQFAGNIGFISAGVGYASRSQKYQLDLLYGYVPKSVAGSYIHTVTAKNIFPLGRYLLKSNRSLIPYVGLGVSLEVGGNSFFKMPSHYPDSYYDFPKNLHAIIYGGVRMQHLFEDDFKLLRGMELYAEAGTIDAYLWYKTMTNRIRFHQIFSVALGVNLMLDHE